MEKLWFDNDRINLVLQIHRLVKSNKDLAEIKELEERYPDNHVYEKEIIDGMVDRGFMKKVASELGNAADGPTKVITRKVVTTDLGITALRRDVFRSEMKAEKRKSHLLTVDTIFKVIAIIGGMLGFINFFYSLLQD